MPQQNAANKSASAPAGTDFSVKTRKTRPLNPPAPPAVPPVNSEPEKEPYALTPEQEKFLFCCGFFVKQAKDQGREDEFFAQVEGRFYGEWPIPLDKDIAHAVVAVSRKIRRELVWAALTARSILPQTSWELVMAMPVSDVMLHMLPYLAQYQDMQRRLGIDLVGVRAHHRDIYELSVDHDNPNRLKLSNDGAIDLTVDVDDHLYIEK